MATSCEERRRLNTAAKRLEISSESCWTCLDVLQQSLRRERVTPQTTPPAAKASCSRPNATHQTRSPQHTGRRTCWLPLSLVETRVGRQRTSTLSSLSSGRDVTSSTPHAGCRRVWWRAGGRPAKKRKWMWLLFRGLKSQTGIQACS